jgi:hypothetical protein
VSPESCCELAKDLVAVEELRRQAVPGLELVDRSDDLIGGLELRRGTGRWEREGGAWVERDSVWRDGWLGYSVAAWAPEGGAAQRALVDLEPHPGPEGTLSGRIDTAASALSAAQPLLSEAAARQALREARTLELTPDAALLRLLAAVAGGRGGLSAADADRLEQIETRLEGSVSRSRRAALRAALRGQGDAQSLELLKQATSGLVPEARVYLRELWARAALAQP